MKRGIILSISIFFIFIFLAPLYGQQRYKIPVENSPSIGSKYAQVTIVEFIDYQ